jgi:hypothetical protein
MRQLKPIIAALLVITPFAANADPITSRVDLQTTLGGVGTVEDFEAYFLPSSAVTTDCSVLNSSSICNGQGPGLVDTNLTISTTGTLQYNGPGYLGATSVELAGTGDQLNVDFLSAVGVAAFGLDLRAYIGFGGTATMNIFAADDSTLLGTISGIVLGSDGIAAFSGWDDATGIGSFNLRLIGQPWSPIIDNIEWGGSGTSVPPSIPEPGTLALLGIGLFGVGLARRRRKA